MRGYVLISAVAISMVTAAACSSDPVGNLGTPDPGNPQNTPQLTPERAFFDANVMPIMEGVCSKCHANQGDQYGAPEFLGVARDQYYDALTKNTSFVGCDVANSILLLKGLDPGHVGGPLSPEQHERVETWLTLEAIARFEGTCGGPGPTPPPPTTGSGAGTGGGGGEGGSGPVDPAWPPTTGQEAMEAFGNCMTLTDWTDSGMPLIANQVAEYQNNNVTCYSCHNNFATGQMALPDPNAADAAEEIERAFEQMRHMYASFGLVRWTVHTEDGSFKELTKSYRLRDKGVGQTTHPTYELDAEYLAYYEDWYTRTMERYATGPCDPAGEPPPEPPPEP